MSLKNVKAFYQRLAQDEEFRSQIKEVKTFEESSQILQQAGYNFTQEEFEDYTSELFETNSDEGELKDLNEKELELVFGGSSSNFPSPQFPLFVLTLLPEKNRFNPPVQPLYGVIVS
ncbi:MAG: Nif11-like leader peptide family natural product precursor [Crocosphaera sp.]